MAGVWKRDGTIAVTKGSKKVVGTGTTFADPKNAAAKGHLLVMVTGTAVDLYEVDYSESNSVFYLVEAYRGDTGTGKAYAIDTSRTDSIPEFARRLNATLGAYQQQGDAFQALLTSDAATIEVTAPDGTKHTMIPWKRVTSEGEGQAARAKAEADKAAASATLAGSIVEASALPLPDVWAPLSDSLRMITGYGRDVLVGSDVVARMVNFTRNTTATYIGKDGQLKTAAANEPRFEKEGLLLEGASTNLIIRSVDMTQWPWVGSSAGTGVAPVVTGNYASAPDGSQTATRLIMNKGAGTPSVNQTTMSCALTTTFGAPYTLSVWLKSTDGVSQPIVSLSLNGDSHSNITVTSEWRRHQVTTLSAIDANRTPRMQLRGDLGTSAYADILVWGWQQEALPFASSYIPTSGAAATRAQDICWIPVQNAGLQGLANEKTMSVVSNIIGVANNFGFILTTPWGAIGYTRAQEQVYGVNTSLSVTSPVRINQQIRRVARFTKGGGATGLFGNNRKDTETGDWMIGNISRVSIGSHSDSSNLPHFGHVRDLKIWLKPLSDEQIKAVA